MVYDIMHAVVKLIQDCHPTSSSVFGRGVSSRQTEPHCRECCSSNLCNKDLCTHSKRKVL